MDKNNFQNIVVILLFSLLYHGQIRAQTYTIPILKNPYSNLKYIEASISGIEDTFIFDTGASGISVNAAFFNRLVRSGKVSRSDILGTVPVTIANGQTVSAQIVNARDFAAGNMTLPNVEIWVIDDPNAPLLIGQSVFNQFGRITIDNVQNLILLEKYQKGTYAKNLQEIKLIQCFDKSQSIKQQTKTTLLGHLPSNIFTEETSLPPQKAVNRITCSITIRYFAHQDHVAAEEIKDLITKNQRVKTICTENMVPYFATEIPNYIEIWFK
ncbi:MAG: retroviral-like aspartic protease family protein [Flammeovirgaceae bacterium]|nr:retroviral-like aspartic protease family protein [Flammeovirgaceae bacterium]MDW8287006.1 retropepsin-like aspartic protease [Flammeovirgaceae bacterium]